MMNFDGFINFCLIYIEKISQKNVTRVFIFGFYFFHFYIYQAPVTPQGGKIKADLAEPPRGAGRSRYGGHAPPGQREQPVALERDGRQERKARVSFSLTSSTS